MHIWMLAGSGFFHTFTFIFALSCLVILLCSTLSRTWRPRKVDPIKSTGHHSESTSCRPMRAQIQPTSAGLWLRVSYDIPSTTFCLVYLPLHHLFAENVAIAIVLVLAYVDDSSCCQQLNICGTVGKPWAVFRTFVLAYILSG